MALHVEWDDAKAARNERKHGVSFAEARSLFTSGTNFLEIFDVEHSLDEERFICIGPIDTGIVVVVIAQVDDDVIRIISARWATNRERTLLRTFLEESSP